MVDHQRVEVSEHRFRAFTLTLPRSAERGFTAVTDPPVSWWADPDDKSIAWHTHHSSRPGQRDTYEVRSDYAFPPEPIVVYTDGACSGNPGPMGAGVLIRRPGEVEQRISQPLGQGTNNLAELKAIRLALTTISRNNPPLPLPSPNEAPSILLYTDSVWSIGVVTGVFRAKVHTDLIGEIQHLVRTFSKVHFIHVRGHAGNEGNTIADRLATQAIRGAL
jgi:ribonuclease HI